MLASKKNTQTYYAIISVTAKVFKKVVDRPPHNFYAWWDLFSSGCK
jgi:hypothetical protein